MAARAKADPDLARTLDAPANEFIANEFIANEFIARAVELETPRDTAGVQRQPPRRSRRA